MWATQAPINSSTTTAATTTTTTTTTTSANKTLGMTSAISLAGPKPIDHIRTSELKEVIKRFNAFESEEELNHRMEILR